MASKIAIFLKYPKPGQVKTRIAKDSSDKIAASIYKRMVENVIDRLDQQKLILYYTGCTLQKMNDWLPKFDYELQSNGDLGDRLIQATKNHFDSSNDNFIIIGTDCLEISSKIIEKVDYYLEKNDFVIGPTYDGGYYLLAMKNFYPDLFQAIDWSTENVYKQTINQGRKNKLNYKSLSIKHDIDYWNEVPDEYKKLINYKDE